MASNLPVNDGTGSKSIVTDEISTDVHLQVVKAAWGGTGVQNFVDSASGKALPIQIRDADGTAVALSVPVATIGVTTGTKVVTDANGTIQQYLRGIVTFLANALGAGTAAAASRVTLASDDPAVATLGAVSGTKVVTDANGTLQQYLRGLVVFFANALGAGTAAAAHRTTLASDDPAVATLGATTGTKVVTDANGTIQQYLRGIVTFLANALGAGTAAAAIRIAIASDTALPAGTNAIGIALGRYVTISTSITRPGDTNVYAAEDAFANSTSAPTSGGFTLTGAGSGSGKSGIITDAVISLSTNAGTSLQGEIWIYDQAVSAAINDNAAFTQADADALNLVGKIPFTTNESGSVNAVAFVTGLNIGFTCVGTANLRFLVKVKNAYTPANAEVLQVRLKILQID